MDKKEAKNPNPEDAEDLAAFEDRKNEPLISYEEMVEELKKEGLI